jgi:hypothetical protein
MVDAEQDATQRVESVSMILLGAGVLLLLVPGMAVGVIIDHRCVADRVEVMLWRIFATRELFSENEGMVF